MAWLQLEIILTFAPTGQLSLRLSVPNTITENDLAAVILEAAGNDARNAAKCIYRIIRGMPTPSSWIQSVGTYNFDCRWKGFRDGFVAARVLQQRFVAVCAKLRADSAANS